MHNNTMGEYLWVLIMSNDSKKWLTFILNVSVVSDRVQTYSSNYVFSASES